MSAITSHSQFARRGLIVCIIAAIALGVGIFSCQSGSKQGAFMEPVTPPAAQLSSTGRNPYFVLEPGYQLVLETKNKVDHLTIKVLVLSFLFLIGFSLVADGLGQHIPKGYIYFAMGFSVMVETINIRVRRHGPPIAPTKKS